MGTRLSELMSILASGSCGKFRKQWGRLGMIALDPGNISNAIRKKVFYEVRFI